MIEYVFRPSRIVNGKRVLSRVFCGRYSLDKGMTPVRVSLNTPDREVARKRLRAIVLESSARSRVSSRRKRCASQPARSSRNSSTITRPICAAVS